MSKWPQLVTIMAKDITHVQSSEGKFQVFAPHYRFSLNIIQSPDLHCDSERTFHHNRCYERKFIAAQHMIVFIQITTIQKF